MVLDDDTPLLRPSDPRPDTDPRELLAAEFYEAIDHAHRAPPGWLWIHRALMGPVLDDPDRLLQALVIARDEERWWQTVKDVVSDLDRLQGEPSIGKAGLLCLERRVTNVLRTHIYLVAEVLSDRLRTSVRPDELIHELGAAGLPDAPRPGPWDLYEWLAWRLKEHVELPMLQTELEGEGISPRAAFVKVRMALDLVKRTLSAPRTRPFAAVLEQLWSECEALARHSSLNAP